MSGSLYSVATGRLSLFRKASREACRFMGEREGFKGVHVHPETGSLLWFFDSENAAKVARNEAEAQGIECGRNICKWNVAADGVPEFDSDWARERGMA